MRLLADLHISPKTVEFLRSLAHDVVRVHEVLSVKATDDEIVVKAREEGRAILTQDLDFSAIIALSHRPDPSLITLRLASSRTDYVNRLLARILPSLEEDVQAGVMVTVEDNAVRRRNLPF